MRVKISEHFSYISSKQGSSFPCAIIKRDGSLNRLYNQISSVFKNNDFEFFLTEAELQKPNTNRFLHFCFFIVFIYGGLL